MFRSSPNPRDRPVLGHHVPRHPRSGATVAVITVAAVGVVASPAGKNCPGKWQRPRSARALLAPSPGGHPAKQPFIKESQRAWLEDANSAGA